MKNKRDIKMNTQFKTVPQGREPFHPRKQTGPTASFLGALNHERDMENKALGITSTSVCAPVDVAPC